MVYLGRVSPFFYFYLKTILYIYVVVILNIYIKRDIWLRIDCDKKGTRLRVPFLKERIKIEMMTPTEKQAFEKLKQNIVYYYESLCRTWEL